MIIGVLSDTHIPMKAKNLPEVILNKFKEVDLIIHAGDFTSIEVLEQLQKFSKVEAVCGNMDNPQIREILPSKKIIEVLGLKIGIIHGQGPPSKLINYIKNEFHYVDCIIFGHSHTPYNAYVTGTLCFNPGSPTDDIFPPFKSYGILEINGEIKSQIIKV
jgi:hypothetical protein